MDMLTRKMPDLRAPVLRALKRQEMTTYQLVQKLKGKRKDGKDVPPAVVYEFVRGDTNINSADLGLIYDVLGITVK